MANWPFSEDASKRTLAGDVEVLMAELSKAWRDRDELLAALTEAREAWNGKNWDSSRSMRCAEMVDALIARIKAGNG